MAIPELGLHRNLTLADRILEVNVILSSGKHELAPRLVMSKHGTVATPGPIKLEDLCYFMPVGAQIAKGQLTGAQIRKTLEGAPQGERERPGEWINGWIAGYGGLTADFDPLALEGNRVSHIRVNGQPLGPNASYSVAGFYYDLVPKLINRVPAKELCVFKDKDGSLLDGGNIVKM